MLYSFMRSDIRTLYCSHDPPFVYCIRRYYLVYKVGCWFSSGLGPQLENNTMVTNEKRKFLHHFATEWFFESILCSQGSDPISGAVQFWTVLHQVPWDRAPIGPGWSLDVRLLGNPGCWWSGFESQYSFEPKVSSVKTQLGSHSWLMMVSFQ